LLKKVLDNFFVREWGGDRGNVRKAGRENNGSVKDRNESMFKKVGWQEQWRGGKGSVVETIPPHGNLCRAHRDGGRPLLASRVTQEGEPTHSFSVVSMDVILIGMGCSLCGRLPSASESGI
jgi:hypothetical protein